MPQKTQNVFKRGHVLAGILYLFVVFCLTQQIPKIAAASDGNPTDILIVSNKSVPESSISPAMARDLFLKVRKSWKNGAKAIPIVPRDSQLQSDFRKKVLHMDAAEETRYWENVKIKYGQSKPATISNSQKAIFGVKGSVTYVYRKDYKAGASKIICVVPAS